MHITDENGRRIARACEVARGVFPLVKVYFKKDAESCAVTIRVGQISECASATITIGLPKSGYLDSEKLSRVMADKIMSGIAFTSTELKNIPHPDSGAVSDKVWTVSVHGLGRSDGEAFALTVISSAKLTWRVTPSALLPYCSHPEHCRRMLEAAMDLNV